MVQPLYEDKKHRKLLLLLPVLFLVNIYGGKVVTAMLLDDISFWPTLRSILAFVSYYTNNQNH